uniref:receptor protein-tyrosine kinase n=1 Tax=Echeneis naucrates TaxID=173247 RepID=A0A665WKW5_ECHNA
TEPVMIPARVPRFYLTPDQLTQLHFKPTIGSIQLSEGHEARFNCSIEIPDTRVETIISWERNGQDLAANSQVVINELQTITDGVTTLLSTVRYVKNVTRNTPFKLLCEAIGPPEPVRIRWLRDGLPVPDLNLSSSSYTVQGVDKFTQFSCEAYNLKGVATSREANINIKVLPSPVSDVTVLETQSNKLTLSWSPGHDGFSPLTKCHIRVRPTSGEVTTTRFINVTVPPFQSEVPGLQAMTSYNMSVSCSNELGASPVSSWVLSNTTEGVPSVYPRNVTVRLNGSLLVIRWKPPPDDKINGILRGYDVIVKYGTQEKKVSLSTMLSFRRVFGGGEKPQPIVEYKPQRSYNRSAMGVTLGNLGVSDELQAKLQDVMVMRNLLSIGKVLGEGEFGSVVEGHLRQQDGTSEKVAVKTMKCEEIEEFLNEAACMKDFNHPNVIRLLGVCLEVSSGHFPKPMVILPFMKYGDLHSFLLRSRLGESPMFLPTQTLLKFMVDIALGMEYLSGRNFLHRDLAARNCMLRDDMTVCVADFGLSKKIYSGDYYRQGRIAKMPVKWIAVESLADRVFTVKSDVWAFGITMWEIATRGMTPYPGIPNHEIYDYLVEGHRLKQPTDCLDELYEIMYSCWRADPLDRPLFPQLRERLEKLTEKLPESFSRDDIIYINTSFPEEDPDREMLPAEHPVFSSSPSCRQRAAENSVVTADIHGSLEDTDDEINDRYVVVVSSEPSLRSPDVDTPLLSSDALSQANGDMVSGMDNSSSDTSLLL